MNIIIYTVVILTIFYFLLRLITKISSRKISKGLRFLLILGLIALAVLFAIGGKFLLTLPLTLASLALLKLKGLSIFQLISLFRLIQTLRRSGRFTFNQSNSNNQIKVKKLKVAHPESNSFRDSGRGFPHSIVIILAMSSFACRISSCQRRRIEALSFAVRDAQGLKASAAALMAFSVSR